MSSPYTLAPATSLANLTAKPVDDRAPLVRLVVDGGARAGFGHVGRCLALWEELGGRAVFDVKDADVLRALKSLGARTADTDPVSRNAPPRVTLIDRRCPTDVSEVRALRAHGQLVCLLDDPGEGRLEADLVVDPPTGACWPAAAGRRLGGFEHALLRGEIRRAAGAGTARHAANIASPTSSAPHFDVLLALGGSDPEGLTPALASALSNVGLTVSSVLGPAYKGARPAGTVLRNPHEWSWALAHAKLLVTRFGHTLLEAAHLGTPALAVAPDERTRVDAYAFAVHGTSEAIGIEPQSARAARQVSDRALRLHEDPLRLGRMSEQGRRLVDGLGAQRVATALRELA